MDSWLANLKKQMHAHRKVHSVNGMLTASEGCLAGQGLGHHDMFSGRCVVLLLRVRRHLL